MRKKRLSEILSIVREYEVKNQENLIRILKERGYNVTQATVSRDINELRLEKKTTEEGKSCYALPSEVKLDRFKGIFSQTVIGVDYAGNIVSVKCHSGLAGAACAAVDLMKLSGIVGTLAGDDTIFILTRNEENAKELADKLIKL